MHKTTILMSMLVFLMSFTTSDPGIYEKNQDGSAFRKKYINVTVTATNGCTVQIQGYVEHTMLPPKLDGFEGTITIGGSSQCPHITLTIQWHGKARSPGKVGLALDNDELCSVTKSQWTAESKEIEAVLNDDSLNAAFVSAIKEGECK
ncbi:MAG TPA: hypothetical protein VF476_05260 [Chitinophagaceae bacterium]